MRYSIEGDQRIGWIR